MGALDNRTFVCVCISKHKGVLRQKRGANFLETRFAHCTKRKGEGETAGHTSSVRRIKENNIYAECDGFIPFHRHHNDPYYQQQQKEQTAPRLLMLQKNNFCSDIKLRVVSFHKAEEEVPWQPIKLYLQRRVVLCTLQSITLFTTQVFFDSLMSY